MTFNEIQIISNEIKKSELKKRRCGAAESLVLYAEGQARRWMIDKVEKGTIEWAGQVNYIVCYPNCGATTLPFPTPEEAVAAWNGGESGC